MLFVFDIIESAAHFAHYVVLTVLGVLEELL